MFWWLARPRRIRPMAAVFRRRDRIYTRECLQTEIVLCRTSLCRISKSTEIILWKYLAWKSTFSHFRPKICRSVWICQIRKLTRRVKFFKLTHRPLQKPFPTQPTLICSPFEPRRRKSLLETLGTRFKTNGRIRRADWKDSISSWNLSGRRIRVAI